VIKITYDYKCNECEKEFTIERSMKDDSDVICEFCGSKDVKRIFNVPTFKINCSGFCGKINP